MDKLGVNKTERYSLYRALPYWYVACRSKEVGKRPVQVRLWDTPIVLFRDSKGTVHALLDRCPHRNVPLSSGKCVDGHIQCPYHGWEFDGDGLCQKIPALCGPITGNNRNVPKFETREQQGYIWIYTDINCAPNHDPFSFPYLDDSAYTSVMYQADFEGTIHANAENILDVPHTAFLHKGLFRGGEPNKIQTIIRRFTDRAECEYVGEPRPTGLIGKILAPSGGEIYHCDRFILPSVAQVEYRLGRAHLITTSCLTPISDFKTRMYAVVSAKLNNFLPLIRPFVTPFALRIVKQDIKVLSLQRKTIQEFAGEQYTYTDVDVLGPSITRLLRKAVKENLIVHQKSPEKPESVITSEMLA